VKNYEFSFKLFTIISVVIAVLVLGLYWESQQSVLGCFGVQCGVNPYYAKEKISFSSVLVDSPSNVTVTVSNTGSETSALAEYFVKDSSGNTYSNTTWAGPTVNPGASASVNILLTGQPMGQPFQFQSGHTYTLAVVTARNNQFSVTFTP
jgi:hypothetical protein